MSEQCAGCPDRESCGGTSSNANIANTILVLSGKGGVGKSTVAVNLALGLQQAGRRVGLLDVDLHGPSVPTMLGLTGARVVGQGDCIRPVDADGLAVMSIGFLLPETDDAVIWRGPRKMGVIQQFLQEVAWGELDHLVVDLPPGTGDEPLSMCQLVEEGAIGLVVTSPQAVATADVRKSISFCRKLDLPVLGVVENLAGFACPHCGEVTHIFAAGGGATMAADLEVPFLGSIPIDPGVVTGGDVGEPYLRTAPDSPAATAFRGVIDAVLAQDPA